MQPCPTARDKVSMLCEAAMIAKTECVAEFGIGEEIPMTFNGWIEDRITLSCGIKREPNQALRYVASCETLSLMRKGWGCTAFTMLHEGFYCAVPVESPAAEYAAGNPNVRECLVVLHVERDLVSLTSVPFIYELGRRVIFDPPTTQQIGVIATGPYPAAMWNALREEPIPDLRKRTVKRLAKIGVKVHEYDLQ